MALTVASCYTAIEHTLGGPTSASVPKLMLVNQAGNHWASMRSWKCLERPSVQLSLVAAQGYITLPADFGEFITDPAENSGATANGMLRFGTHEEVIWLQAQNTTGDPASFVGAMSYSTAGLPILEIGPVPQTSYGNVFTASYRARWTEITNDNATLTILPSYMEPLFINLVRAFARGYEEEDEGSLTDRLNKIQQGAIYAAAVLQDTRTQPNYGPLAGGGASRYFGGYGRFPSNITVPDP